MWGLGGVAGLGLRRVSAQGTQPTAQRPPPTAIVAVAVAVHDYVGAGVGLAVGRPGPSMAQRLGSCADLRGIRDTVMAGPCQLTRGPGTTATTAGQFEAQEARNRAWLTRGLAIPSRPTFLPCSKSSQGSPVPLHKNQIPHCGPEVLCGLAPTHLNLLLLPGVIPFQPHKHPHHQIRTNLVLPGAFAPPVPSAWNTLLPELCPLILCLRVPRTMPSTQLPLSKYF